MNFPDLILERRQKLKDQFGIQISNMDMRVLIQEAIVWSDRFNRADQDPDRCHFLTKFDAPFKPENWKISFEKF